MRLLPTAAAAVLLSGCTSVPPPRPYHPYTGPIPKAERGVTWMPGIWDGRSALPAYCMRALSIDGGGMRGIIPAMVLADLERRTGKRIGEMFDTITGTSTGGILALGLAKADPKDPTRPHYSAAELVDLYKKDGKKIFPRKHLSWLKAFFRPKHSPAGLEEALARYFGDARFKDTVPDLSLTVTAYDLENRRHYFFDRYADYREEFLMRDVAAATSAAPTYLPPVSLEVPRDVDPKGYLAFIDGGVFANNPAPFALDRSLGWSYARRGRGILLISLGTGQTKTEYTYRRARRWGKFAWLRPVLDIVLSDPGVARAMDAALEGKGRHERFQPVLDTETELDATGPQSLAALEAAGAKLIEDNEERLAYLAKELSRSRTTPDSRCVD